MTTYHSTTRTPDHNARINALLDDLRAHGHQCRAYDTDEGHSIRIVYDPPRNPEPAVTIHDRAVYFGDQGKLRCDIIAALTEMSDAGDAFLVTHGRRQKGQRA